MVGKENLEFSYKFKFPFLSFIGLMHAVFALIWYFSLSKNIIDSLGYGISQLGYAVLVGAIFTGNFRVFKIYHNRLHAFGLAIILLIVGVFLQNV